MNTPQAGQEMEIEMEQVDVDRSTGEPIMRPSTLGMQQLQLQQQLALAAEEKAA